MRASLFLLLLLTSAFADKPPVPRTADGHPDLSGVWQGGSLSFAIGIENAKKKRASPLKKPPASRPMCQARIRVRLISPGPLRSAKSFLIERVSTIL